MTAAATKTAEMVMAYVESELGCVLVVETSGTAYGSKRAKDGVKFLTGQTLPQMGTREINVHPHIRDYTG